MIATRYAVTPTAAPFVRAMVTGPATFLEAVTTRHVKHVGFNTTRVAIVAAAVNFEQDLVRAKIDTGPLHNAIAFVDSASPSLAVAARALATTFLQLPSGHYAVGRAGLQSAMVEKRGVLTLDDRLLSRRKPAV